MVVMASKLSLKRNFVRHISHEVRTPLNTIICGLNYLKTRLSNTNAAEAEMLSIINDMALSGEDAVEVLDEILTYDKIESKTLVLNLSTFTVVSFLERTLRPFSVQAVEGGIELHTSYSVRFQTHYQELEVLADKNKIAQVVRNMISNALKFTKIAGGDKLVKVLVDCVSVAEEDSNNTDSVCSLLQIRVQDTGPGISQVQSSKGKRYASQ